MMLSKEEMVALVLDGSVRTSKEFSDCSCFYRRDIIEKESSLFE